MNNIRSSNVSNVSNASQNVNNLNNSGANQNAGQTVTYNNNTSTNSLNVNVPG